MKSIKIFLFSFLVFVAFLGKAQQSLVYAHENATYKRAVELFKMKKYVVAQRKFQKVYNNIEAPQSEIKMSSEFYVAMCALELFNKDAEYLFEKFIEHHPQSPMVKRAKFHLGRYNYRKKRWSSTVKWFEQVDENDLEPNEKPEYNFKYGYALFRKKKFDEAQKYFHKAKSVESDYQSSAQFYFAHLAYKFSFYETAYREFKVLENDVVFGRVIPYYMTQILYLQNKNEELVKYAVPFLDSANTSRAPEIARLVGEGYYKLNNYNKSVVYFEKFKAKAAEVDTMAYFQLGYAYYKTGKYDKALENLKMSMDDETEIGQLSMYYSGDCFLKLGNKESARRSFKFAYRNDHDLNITENALFNYAKLSFELDIDPYHESIIALENYIATYPKSENVDKARKILLNVYLNTKNYKRAINALDKIENKGPELQYAYQKIAYYRGVQEFNQQSIGFQNNDLSNYKKAIFYFDKSLAFPEDQTIVSLAKYWKAESLYRLGLFEKALLAYQGFKKSPGSILLKEYKEVDYQLGYTYLRLNNYGPAIHSFRDYINKHNVRLGTEKLNDAYLRTGDAYLILSNNLTGAQRQNELIHAVKYYKSAIEVGKREVDYGYYQLGQAYKLLNKYELEAEAFENLIYKHPNSPYIDDAKFKAGEVYFERLQKYDIAYKYFSDIVNNHTNNTALVQQSLNKMANIKRVKGDFETAASLFEQSVSIDPRTEFAGNALRGLKQVSTFDLKDANRYLSFRQNTGLPDESQGAKDTLTFESAKGYFIENDYTKTISKLSGYLNDFPNGIFLNDANYMLGQSYFALGNKELAQQHFDKVIEAPYGEYTEEALYKSSQLYLEKEDFKNAISRFQLLQQKSEYAEYIKDAHVGLMTSFNAIEMHDSTAKYAKLVEQNKLVDNASKFQAALLLGNAKFRANKYDEAKIAYQRIVAKTQKVMAAEALYQLAYIDYIEGDIDSSKGLVVRLLKEFSNYPYWTSKGFVLLSDILIKKDDLVSAKYTLKNILEHYDDPEIIESVNKRLKQIEALEAAAIAPKKEEEVIINIGDTTNVNDRLYDIEEEDTDLDTLPVEALPNDTIQSK